MRNPTEIMKTVTGWALRVHACASVCALRYGRFSLNEIFSVNVTVTVKWCAHVSVCVCEREERERQRQRERQRERWVCINIV